MKRILVIEQYGMGDAVLALPALQAMRRELPQARLAGVATGSALAARQAFGPYDDLLEPAQVGPGGWEAVVDLTGRRQTARLAYRTRAPIRLGTPWWVLGLGASRYYSAACRPTAGAHVVEHQLSLVRRLGIAAPLVRPAVKIAAQDQEAAEKWLGGVGVEPAQPLVALHPGGRSRWRNWGAGKYRDLAAVLAEQGIRCLAVGNEAERPLLEAIARGCPPARLALAVQVPLGRLAALLARCQVFVGGDSGPLHLAGAAGAPVVALFGRSDASWSGPFGRQAQVLSLGWPCSPCRSRPRERWRPCWRRHGCLRHIPVEMVLEAVLRALNRPGQS